jgi:hypothetical protein
MISVMRAVSVDQGTSMKIVFIDTLGKEAYSGQLDTDLNPGRYKLRVDRRQKKWVILEPAVKAGLRFHIDLDGADPWTLTYAAQVSLEIGSDFAIGDILLGSIDIGKVPPSEHPTTLRILFRASAFPCGGGRFPLIATR